MFQLADIKTVDALTTSSFTSLYSIALAPDSIKGFQKEPIASTPIDLTLITASNWYPVIEGIDISFIKSLYIFLLDVKIACFIFFIAGHVNNFANVWYRDIVVPGDQLYGLYGQEGCSLVTKPRIGFQWFIENFYCDLAHLGLNTFFDNHCQYFLKSRVDRFFIE